MIHRRLYSKVLDSLKQFPVVGLIGARQIGKTTLAKWIAESIEREVIFLDLERPSDLAKLQEPELYLEQHKDRLVILDEVHHRPEIFRVLRVLIDDHRIPGRFLITGSASPDLIRQSSETLAGRIVYHELQPIDLWEIDGDLESIHTLWFRGGFPDSLTAESEEQSTEWREAFIKTYLERDLPSLGFRLSPNQVNRFWQMLAHSHGQIWNANTMASSLGISAPTARSYLDILENTFMVKQIQPYFTNIKKRLVKSPKVYIADSGILHGLLNIRRLDDLFGHPVVGFSWEGWAIQQTLSILPAGFRPYYFRTYAGAEIDLILERPGGNAPLAFEFKFSKEPHPTRGFYTAIRDLGADNAFMVAPIGERYPIRDGIVGLPVKELPEVLK